MFTWRYPRTGKAKHCILGRDWIGRYMLFRRRYTWLADWSLFQIQRSWRAYPIHYRHMQNTRELRSRGLLKSRSHSCRTLHARETDTADWWSTKLFGWIYFAGHHLVQLCPPCPTAIIFGSGKDPHRWIVVHGYLLPFVFIVSFITSQIVSTTS